MRLPTSHFRLSSIKFRQVSGLLIPPVVAALTIAVRATGGLQLFEWAAFDQFLRLRPLEPPDPRIVVITVDEPDIREVGQWPLPDATIAELVKIVRRQDPVAIGLDIYRDLPVQPGHEELLDVYETTPNLIGVEKVVADGTTAAIAPPPQLKEKGRVASIDLVLDADGRVRRGLLSVQPDDDRTILSLGARLALMYLEGQGITPTMTEAGNVKLGDGVFVRFTGNDGGYVGADSGGYQVLLNYRGPQENFDTIDLTDVLEGRAPPDWFRDRIVLIGPIGQSLNDLFFTPYSGGPLSLSDRMPGVVIHANVASQMIGAALDGRPQFRVWSDKVEWAWILIWAVSGAVLGWTYRFSLRVAVSLAVAGGSLVAGSYLAFLEGWWVPVVPPMLAFAGSGIAIAGYIANLEHQERQMVMTLFGRHVTPQIAEMIWQSRDELIARGQLTGQKMVATVLFADLKGFSTIAETMEADALMVWLNEYMNGMADIVLDHKGIVDKFIGDAVMAVFGVPIPRTTPEEISRDAIAAVSCAVEMGKKLRSLNRQWQIEGKPTVSMRVGIATGEVVTGSLGSSQRMDYTTLGDSVNIAARLESYDKSFGTGVCRILMSQETHKQIGGRFLTHFVGRIHLKGRTQAIDVYQIAD
ncbi:adenylate/guanylate cyclase domain-containing protein [Lyngbya sp. CCY1209]|uniref:CHASE2 domain-containing protein n=1 Tax=Lyngbya sp. CCY1209 TaxID=2886103 RepID=UPI002D79B54B|nr:adenylate/guanylate cyclase domain-containing protein [Lyngbya sp. CCY1209]